MKLKTLLIGCVLFASPVFAQTVTVDLGKLDSETAKEILEQTKNKTSSSKEIKENVKDYAEIAQVIGSVLKDSAHTLNIESNDFAKSELGRQIIFLIIYNYVGKGWLKVFITFTVFLISLVVFVLTLKYLRSGTTLNGEITEVISFLSGCIAVVSFIGFLIAIVSA